MNTLGQRFALVITGLLLVTHAQAQDYLAPVEDARVSSRVGWEEPVFDGQYAYEKTDFAKEVYCQPRWAHRTGVFGEYLLLRPRDSEVAYGVLADNVGNFLETGENLIQRSRVFLVDPGYSSNYRLGGTLAFSDCSSLRLTYSSYYGSDRDARSFDPQNVGDARIVPISLHPFPQDASQFPLDAQARSAIQYKTADVDFRSVLWASELGALNYLVGGRYAHLDQRYASLYGGTGMAEQADSRVRFDGGGLRFGLDGERHHSRSGFLLYGHSVVSLVAGQFHARYQYESDLNPSVPVVDTGWNADRIVSTLDLELGVGWQSRCGHLRVTSGYMISSWFNSVTTDQWLRAVGRNNYVGQPDGMSYDTLMFDGLTVRAELRF